MKVSSDTGLWREFWENLIVPRVSIFPGTKGSKVTTGISLSVVVRKEMWILSGLMRMTGCKRNENSSTITWDEDQHETPNSNEKISLLNESIPKEIKCCCAYYLGTINETLLTCSIITHDLIIFTFLRAFSHTCTTWSISTLDEEICYKERRFISMITWIGFCGGHPL